MVLSTRGRIVLLVVLAALPVLALTVYSAWDARAQSELHAREDMRRLATMAAQRQEQIVEGARQTLVAIALAPAGEPARCNEFLAKLRAQSSGIYHSMGIYRSDAILICNAIPWQGTIYSPDRLYFRLPATTGKFAIGEYQVGRVTKQRGINVGYPIKDSTGNVMAVAFVAINLSRLNHMAAATPLPSEATVTVVDRDGIVLARNPEGSGIVGERFPNLPVLETMLSGRNGVFQMSALDGSELLWAYEAVTDNPDGVIPLRVLVSIPMSVVFAAADQALARNLAGIALAFTLLLIVAWHGTNFFVLRKVRDLLEAASRVHAGDLGARTGMSHTGDELNQIGAAFDEMTQALQDRDIKVNDLLRKLNEQAMTDPLTGLYNRRFLEESLKRELVRAQRSKAPLALIMADVDHFKSINDTHGHDAGDAVLRSVAQTLKGPIRGSDIACRFGGEEFILVLPESLLDAAREKAESLRQAVAALALSHAGQALGPVTMSFGLAIFPEHGRDFAGLLQAADMALYRAKHEGRNRVEVARAVKPVVSASAPDGPREIESAII